MNFLVDFGLYLKEGIVTEPDQATREEIAKLLRFESSLLPAGQRTSFDEYASRMRAGERNIYFLSAPNRELAEVSPYLEAIKKKKSEPEVGIYASVIIYFKFISLPVLIFDWLTISHFS